MQQLTKAQKEILAEIVINDGIVNNWSQRMRSIQVLLDANLIRQNNIFDSLGFLEVTKFEII
jgi:hypothetical protein